MVADSLEHALQQHFGFASFRPGQRDAVHTVLEGRDMLVVMPTGAGKSLCYQLPALLKSGPTLVISPLIALMKDQVDALRARGIAATFINSSLDPHEQSVRLEGLSRGAFKLVYIAPERLRNGAFRERAQSAGIGLIAVDEAHCISQWGHDFRPDYTAIGGFLEALGRPPVVALTATATPQVQHDITEQLRLHEAGTLVTGFNRPNLQLDVRFTPGDTAKQIELRQFLARQPTDSCGVVYVGRRRDAEEVATFISQVCGRRTVFYHGGLRSDERTDIQNEFMEGRAPIVVATNAFGMGVDKADVRFVVHYTVPGTVEAYYQEAGRAGRDGLLSDCLVLYDPADARLHEWFIENDAPSLDEMRTLYRRLKESARGGNFVISTTGELSQLTNFRNEPKVRVGLRLLESVGLLADHGERNGQSYWELLPATQKVDMQAAMSDVEQRRRIKLKQLRQILAYCNTGDCRRQYILDYFGDPTPPIAEQCCDNCARSAAGSTHATAQSVTEQVPLTILRSVAELPWPVGTGTLTKILTGSRASGVERYSNLQSYSSLARYGQKKVDACIDELIRGRYLAFEAKDKFTVVVLTRSGRQAIQEQWAIPLQTLSGVTPQVVERQPRITTEPAIVGASRVADTVAETGLLFDQGLSPDDIAQQRGLAISTIYNHLASLIERGDLDVARVVPDDKRALIVEAWEAEHRNMFLAPIKQRLPEEISYAEIRCVITALKRDLDRGVLPAPTVPAGATLAVSNGSSTTTHLTVVVAGAHRGVSAPLLEEPGDEGRPPDPATIPFDWEPHDDPVAERFARLRAWRAAVAHAVSAPAFTICHNTTLQQIAERNPRTLDDLRAIKGFGPTRIEQHGPAILVILSRH